MGAAPDAMLAAAPASPADLAAGLEAWSDRQRRRMALLIRGDAMTCNPFDVDAVDDWKNLKMRVAGLGSHDCQSPPRSSLFEQRMSMKTLRGVLGVVRQLFVAAGHQHASPVVFTDDFVSLNANQRVGAHPFDFLSSR